MRKILITVGVALAALVFSSQTVSAVTIGFAPSVSTVNLADSFSIDIVVSNLAGEIVSAYDLDVLYDSSVLAATSVAPTSVLGDEFFFEAFYSSNLAVPGIVDVAGLSLLSDTDLLTAQGGGSVTLATITFSAIGNGNSALDFTFNAFNDVKGMNAQILNLNVNPGQVQVGRISAAVPEPTSAAVFLAGILVSGRALWRRQA